MNFFALSGLINGLTSSLLGLFVFLKNPRDKRYLSFGFFCLMIALWAFSRFMWQISLLHDEALFWNRALMAAAIFIPVVYLQHILILLNEKTYKMLVAYGYLVGLLFFIFDFTPLFVADVAPKLDYRYWAVPGPLFHPFLIIWMAYVVYALFLIYKGFKSAMGPKRNQLAYILTGTIIGFGGGSTNYLLWYNIPIPAYGDILVSVYIAIIAYAILRHNLMDIRIVIRKTAVYTLLTAGLTAVLLSVVLICELFFRQVIGYNSLLAAILAVLIIALIFQPLRDRIQSFIDKIFFKSKYDYSKTLKQISEGLSQAVTLEQINGSLNANLKDNLGISWAEVRRVT